MNIDENLIKKAKALFNKDGEIITGHGLTRKELKQLERAGIIEKQLMKNKDTGHLVYRWKLVSVIARFDPSFYLSTLDPKVARDMVIKHKKTT